MSFTTQNKLTVHLTQCKCSLKSDTRVGRGEQVYLNLVLEYVPETVYRIGKHYSKAGQRMPGLYVKLYTYQMCRSLAYIHTLGVCHRDIKPQARPRPRPRFRPCPRRTHCCRQHCRHCLSAHRTQALPCIPGAALAHFLQMADSPIFLLPRRVRTQTPPLSLSDSDPCIEWCRSGVSQSLRTLPARDKPCRQLSRACCGGVRREALPRLRVGGVAAP